MKKEKDWDYIARLEKAIAKKYGDLTIQNPASFWDEKKESEYLEQLKEQCKKEDKIAIKKEHKEVDGVLVSTKLINKSGFDVCPVCSKYGLNLKDEIYMYKYKCCFACYVKNIEGREEKWLQRMKLSKESNKQ
tara:strand:+ start:397 stop:795 length:399 start_codon:yes stop_codon:yes gene_type:complete